MKKEPNQEKLAKEIWELAELITSEPDLLCDAELLITDRPGVITKVIDMTLNDALNLMFKTKKQVEEDLEEQENGNEI